MTNMQDPFDDLQNGNTDDFDAADLASDEELAEAERFTEVLDRMAAGGGVDLDPREDPTLAALTTVATQLDDNAREATSTPRYASYRSRSREYLLGRIERERAARDAPQPAAGAPRPRPRRSRHPSPPRRQRSPSPPTRRTSRTPSSPCPRCGTSTSRSATSRPPRT